MDQTGRACELGVPIYGLTPADQPTHMKSRGTCLVDVDYVGGGRETFVLPDYIQQVFFFYITSNRGYCHYQIVAEDDDETSCRAAGMEC